MWYQPQLPEEVVELLWDDPKKLIRPSALLKDGDRCTVARFQAGGRSMVIKRYNRKDTFHMLAHLLLRSRARWSWLNGRRLLAGGILTPQPLACVEERRAGVLRLESFLLTPLIRGHTLAELVAKGTLPPDDLRDYAEQFLRLWQQLGFMRIGHGDMKATNFLIDTNNQMWLVDLDGLRVYRSGVLFRRERRLDLARFMQNWQEKPEVAAVFRARIGTG